MTFRLIARLDIKGSNLIKGINLEGVRKLGDPNEFATRYYEQGIDEIIYMDAVASLYGRNSLYEIVEKTSNGIFVPITVGGGIRSIEDVVKLMASGADKVAINTGAIKNKRLITEVANRFGAQCMVLSVEAKKSTNGWEAYIENGREPTGIELTSWVKEAVDLGAGEILLTSVDQEGTRKGFDVELSRIVSASVNVPVISSGGFGALEDITKLTSSSYCSGAAFADALHYSRFSVGQIRDYCLMHGIPARTI